MIELRTIKTHHVQVQVLVGGAGEDVVLLHDSGGITPEHPFLNMLAERYRVHAPLLPGYGDSEEAPSIRDMLDVTLHSFDVVEALGLRRPMLIGCSLGGMIAAEMAAIAPHEVARLILIAPAGCGWTSIRSPTCSRPCRMSSRGCCSTILPSARRC